MISIVGSLRYFSRIKNGTTPASGEAEYWGGNVLWATPEDLGKLTSDRISATKRQVTAKAVAEANLSVLPVGSVIISTRAPIGHMAINDKPMSFNQGCRGIIPSDKIHGPFLYYLLSSRVPELNAVSNGTTFVELSRDELAAVRVIFPEFDSQRRIADFLDERTTRIDGLIAKKTRLLELLAEQRQALITRAVTKGLDPSAPMKPSGIDWLGDIPTHWSVRRLKFIALVRISNVDKIIIEEEKSVSLCNYTDVYYNDVITSDLPFIQGSATIAEIERFKLRHDQVILTKDSESWDDIGIPAYVPHDLSGVVCGYHLAVTTPDNEHLSGRYLSWLCRSESLNGQFKIAANGVTRFALGLYGIKNAKVFTPPLTEQKRIADFLDKKTAQIDHTVTKVQASIGLLREYRAALITAAVTGKIATLLPAAVTQPAARQAPAAFKRAVLAVYIADRMCDQATFGRVQFQKILHLSEVHLGIDEVDGNYYRDAAGPFDTAMMRSVHSQFKKQGWIIAKRREDNKGTQYRRGVKIDAYKTYFDRYFGDKKEAIDRLLTLMKPMKTKQAEIVSTCFAAWNDLLIEGRNPSDDEIVNLIWNDWNESKRNIARKRWYDALGWMRSKGIVPQKRGKHTKKKAKK